MSAAAAAAVTGAAAGVPALAAPAELAAFHRKLQALELDDIYELIAAHLAKAGWRQMLSYDPKDPFSVADAEALIISEPVHVADLGMSARFKKKTSEWIRASGRTYMRRLMQAFGGVSAPQSTEITPAMQGGYEANDEQVRQLVGMKDFPTFEVPIRASLDNCFVCSRKLL
eukprot:SAG11_NODE_60_length_19094_cov_26.549566_14_plen_171_part_00